MNPTARELNCGHGELEPGNDEGTSTLANMAGGSRAAGHGGPRAAGHGGEEEEAAVSSMGKRKRISRCRPWRRGRGGRRPWGRRRGGRAVIQGEEEADLAPPAMEKRKRSSPGMGKRKRSSPATGKRGAGHRRRGRGHSRRRSPAADGEEGTGPLPRGRGRSPTTVKRQLGPIPLNTEGSGSVLG